MIADRPFEIWAKKCGCANTPYYFEFAGSMILEWDHRLWASDAPGDAAARSHSSLRLVGEVQWNQLARSPSGFGSGQQGLGLRARYSAGQPRLHRSADAGDTRKVGLGSAKDNNILIDQNKSLLEQNRGIWMDAIRYQWLKSDELDALVDRKLGLQLKES